MQRQDTDERLRRLQTDKESLVLQVQVLTEQVQAQSEKISELESKVTEKVHSFNEVEERLHREMLSRSSLETQKLELLSVMSDLKLKLASLERDNFDLRSSYQNNNNNTSSVGRRPPLAPSVSASTRGMLTSTPQSSPAKSGSYNSLQQSVTTPKVTFSSFFVCFLFIFCCCFRHHRQQHVVKLIFSTEVFHVNHFQQQQFYLEIIH